MTKKYIKIILLLFIISVVFLFLKTAKNLPGNPSSSTNTSLSSPLPISSPSPTLFPAKHLIKTTFVPQAPEKNWDQPWQDSCEEAALLTVYYFYQHQNPDTDTIVTDIQNMIAYEDQNQLTKDVNLDQMAQIAAHYLSYQTKIISNPTLDQIKTYLISNIPVVVPANGKQLFAENHFFTNGGPFYHNLVILGYDDKKQQFTVHDVGTQHGAYFKSSYRLLLDSIHDFPASGHKEDITSGAKNILVLLQ